MATKAKTVHYWLMKSEPSAYSIDDLRRDRMTSWDGVRNYQVRNFLRDQMQPGDRALFYHSSTATVGVVGEMSVVGKPYPDPTQFDPKSEYYDPRSPSDAPRWFSRSLRYLRTFPRVVTLSELRADPVLRGMRLLKKGNRLSIVPLTKSEYETILKKAG